MAARAVSLWWGDAPFWANATVVHGALLEIDEAPAVHPQRVRHFLVRVGHGFLFGAWLVPVQVLLQLGLHAELKVTSPAAGAAGKPRPPVDRQVEVLEASEFAQNSPADVPSTEE